MTQTEAALVERHPDGTPSAGVQVSAATGAIHRASKARLRRVLSLLDFEPSARRRLPRPIYGYVSGASEMSASFRDNRDAFQEWGFIPQILAGVGSRSTSTSLFDQTYAAPFGISPMGLSALVAYRGDLILASAANAANIPMIMSGSSLIPLEDLIKVNPKAWFQAYLPGEPDRIEALLDRVAAAGFETLVFTVDTVVSSNRENIIRTGFSTPLKPSLRLAWDGLVRPGWLANTLFQTLVRHGMPHFENSSATRGAPVISSTVLRDFGARDHLNWSHLELIRKRWKGRLILKGLVAPKDAHTAWKAGVDGLILSNHGGRQLDYTVSPLRTLPEVATLIKGQIPIMMDGGVRRGSDVLKALGLGADFVFVGRPFLYAAAVAGEAGTAHGISLLKEEILRNLGLLGINAPTEMSTDYLRPLGSKP
jgi:L-lactate dehydrogenase (cytochrome)